LSPKLGQKEERNTSDPISFLPRKNRRDPIKSSSRVLKNPEYPKMAIGRLSTPCVKLTSFLNFSPASREKQE
jgi:hypothetical protein